MGRSNGHTSLTELSSTPRLMPRTLISLQSLPPGSASTTPNVRSPRGKNAWEKLKSLQGSVPLLPDHEGFWNSQEMVLPRSLSDFDGASGWGLPGMCEAW